MKEKYIKKLKKLLSKAEHNLQYAIPRGQVEEIVGHEENIEMWKYLIELLER